MSTLLNPILLTAIFSAIGGAIVWLWTQIKAEREKGRERAEAAAGKHRECELELAKLTERDKARDKEATGLRTTCDELMKIVAKGGANA